MNVCVWVWVWVSVYVGVCVRECICVCIHNLVLLWSTICNSFISDDLVIGEVVHLKMNIL